MKTVTNIIQAVFIALQNVKEKYLLELMLQCRHHDSLEFATTMLALNTGTKTQ